MLTAILTHHLGWVSTVAAFNSISSLTQSSTAAIEQRAKLLQVSQKHPYNALWAQMGDLYGAIGLPPRLARTIIYGTEKLAVERLLNILTYFIRCGEVRRSAKREDFNKDTLNFLLQKRKNEVLKKSSSGSYQRGSNLEKVSPSGGVINDWSNGGGGLKRTHTCKLNLNKISDNGELSENIIGEEEKSSDEEMDGAQVVRTLKKNEIPNVLAFRDSRFVQQELRIGNYLMDTGIEKKSLLRFGTSQNINNRMSLAEREEKIRVLITTPDNEELCIEDGSSLGGGSTSEEGAVEAIEIDTGINGKFSYADAGIVDTGKRHFFWQVVKEGLSLKQLQRGEKPIHMSYSGDCDQLQRQMKLDEPVYNLSLSDLITQNSMGKSDRMTWGIEPRRENVSLEEEIHFDNCQKNRGKGKAKPIGGVVFMLGENEPLVNLKKSNEDLITAIEKEGTKATHVGDTDNGTTQQLCPLHQHTHGSTSKRHSGVKFNFEQFPQIATNYMKSKNLVLSNYDLLMDKSTKLETQGGGVTLECLTSEPSASASTAIESTANNSTECMVCNSILNSYQTPSNATELEFETDEIRSPHCQQPVTNVLRNPTIHMPLTNTHTLQTVSSAASIDTLKSSSVDNFAEFEPKLCSPPSPTDRQKTYHTNTRKVSSHRGSISSVAAKCAAVNEALHLVKLPVPGVRDMPQEDEPSTEVGMKLRAGFVPSLFLNVSDHYVSDMVLQVVKCCIKLNEEIIRDL